MALLNLFNACLGFGDFPLLKEAELHIERGERICLVGRNGVGKSTLMKVLAGELTLDDGKLSCEKETIITRLAQNPPRHIEDTVFDYVAEGIAKLAELLKQYHHISQKLDMDDENLISTLSEIQTQLEHHGGWQFEQRIQDTLKLLSLEPDKRLCELSGGWVRRAALARALVSEPDILLLDEPTNHLDIESITWLENLLLSFKGAIVFISHDRAFIRKMATRIVDLDRGKLISYSGDYDAYLVQKSEDLRIEAMQNALFDKFLAQEEAWIRQGIKARRTRNEGRVRALKALRETRRQRQDVQGTAKIQLDQSTPSGKIIFDINNLNYEIEGKTLLENFSATFLRGDKIALVGENGVGKTTFIKLLLGELQPTSGTVRCGTKLEFAYFDQYRTDLDLEKSVMDNVADGKQDIEINGVKRHVLGYLQDFLFPPKRAMTPVKALSGGERNRLLLAKLLLKPTNLLILDEPTNDLDVETLELLEEILMDYQGTLVIVSHDRQFIDNIATECYFFEGEGKLNKYIGGYSDAKQQQSNYLDSQQLKQKAEHKTKTSVLPKATTNTPLVNKENHFQTVKKVKLSYKEQRELASLPTEMEKLEQIIDSLQQEINSADFFAQDLQYTQEKLKQLAEKEAELEFAFQRWEKLENIQNSYN